MRRISESQVAAIRANIHPAAHSSIADWETFDWHRSGRIVDSDVLHSSQAFCISVWGSLFNLGLDSELSARRRWSALDATWILPASHPTISFEFADRGLLNERGTSQPTSIDVLLEFDDLVVTVESKLTEGLGRCSQAKRGFCSGFYAAGSDLKTGTDAPCRLQIQDGKRTPRSYWEVLNQIALPEFVELGERCPFAGSAYQVMRNIVAAHALAERTGKGWRAIFAFPAAADHGAAQVIAQVVSLLKPTAQNNIALLDYNRLEVELSESSSTDDRSLAEYMRPRLQLLGR